MIKISDHFGPGVSSQLKRTFNAVYVEDLIGKSDKEIYRNIRGVGVKFVKPKNPKQ